MNAGPIEAIARNCHEGNRVLQEYNGEDVNPPWDECDPELRESACIGVEHAIMGSTPEQLHASWCETKRAQGWVYGPVKDPAAKTHPCLVDYPLLPEEQRVKDRLFAALVDAFMADQPYIPGDF